jgi:hypothetical protein
MRLALERKSDDPQVVFQQLEATVRALRHAGRFAQASSAMSENYRSCTIRFLRAFGTEMRPVFRGRSEALLAELLKHDAWAGLMQDRAGTDLGPSRDRASTAPAATIPNASPALRLPCGFQRGQELEYFSGTANRWIDGTVTEVTPKGRVQINCKPNYYFTFAEQQCKLRIR